MAYSTKFLLGEPFIAHDSCAVCPSYLEHNYYTTGNKKPMKSEEKSPKTISKMVAKKMERQVRKKHKSNIIRKQRLNHST